MKGTGYYIFLAVSVLATLPCHARLSKQEKMDKAISSSDLAMVKKMIKRYGELEAQVKQDYMEDAEDKVEELKGKVSLWRSPWDLAKLTGGLIFASCMLVAASSRREGGRTFRDHDNKTLTSVIGFSGALLGLYFASKGYFCSTAEERVGLARKVYDELKKAPEKLDTVK